MDEATCQREIDDVHAGVAPEEVLQRTSAEGRTAPEAFRDLAAVSDDEELLDYGLDTTEMRRSIHWDQVWSLP